MYAVIRLAGKQYRVAKGDSIVIDQPTGSSLEPQVLLVVDGDRVVTDRGELAKAKVTLSDEGAVRIRLERAARFRPKQGGASRRTLGHRREMTRVNVAGVALG